MARCAAVLVLAAGVAGFSGGPLNNKRTVARPAAAYANGAPIISWRAATAADPLPQQRAATDGRTLYDLDELADGPPTIFESLVNASTTDVRVGAAVGCGACGVLAAWFVLNSLAPIGGLLFAAAGALAVTKAPLDAAAEAKLQGMLARPSLIRDVYAELARGEMDPRARLARLARLWARASAAVVLSAAGGVRNLLLQCAAVLDRRYGAAFATAKGEILSFDAVALQRQTAQLYDTAAGAVADAFADIDDRFDVNVRLQGTLSAAAGALRWAIPVQPPEVAKQADSPAKASARKFFFGGPQASPVAPRWGAKVQESLPQQTANKAQRFARRVFDAGRRAADSRRPLRAAHAHAPQRRRAVSSDTGGNCANAASLAVLAVLAADHAAQIQEAFENIVRIAGAAATAAADEAQRPLAAPLVAAPIELFQPPPPPPFQPPGGD